jgi:hypothetical protein
VAVRFWTGVTTRSNVEDEGETTLADSRDGVPTLAEWLKLSDHERAAVKERWNPYGGQGFVLVDEITSDFRARYGHLPGLHIEGPGVYHGGQWVIGLRVPFVFDRRAVPSSHLGIMVHVSQAGELPREFADGTRQHEYVWAPPHYEQFVDRAADEIRAQLGGGDMSRDELLSALVGMPFSKWVELNRSWVREGKIEPFE